MAGYCDGCEKHCPLDALECGRGRRMVGEPAEGWSDGGRPEEFDFERRGRGPHGHGPFEHGHGPHGRGEGREFEHHGPHGRGEPFDRHGHGRPEPFEHGPHGRGRRGEEGWEGPPRGPRGRRPSQDELRARLDSVDLAELMHMSGHLLRSPKSGAAGGQGRVMAILAEEESISQRELQERLHIQPGSASEIVSKLESKGYLVRSRGEDRRGNRLTITEDGRTFAGGLQEPGDLFSALDEAERQQLQGLLKKLLTDWVDRFE